MVLLAAIYTWWYIGNVSPVKMTKTLEEIAWMEEDCAFAPPVRIGKNVIHLGQIYFDEALGRLAWSVPQSELPPELTNKQFPEAEVWLVTPASSEDDARSLRQELEDGYFAKLRLK